MGQGGRFAGCELHFVGGDQRAVGIVVRACDWMTVANTRNIAFNVSFFSLTMYFPHRFRKKALSGRSLRYPEGKS